MSYKTLLVITAIVSLVFGLALMILPAQLFTLYNVEVNAGGIFIARLLGAAFLSYVALNWVGLNVSDASGRLAIVTANLVGNLLGFVISLYGQLRGETGANALGWSTVAIYFLLAAGFTYYLFAAKGAPLNTATGDTRR